MSMPAQLGLLPLMGLNPTQRAVSPFPAFPRRKVAANDPVRFGKESVLYGTMLV